MKKEEELKKAMTDRSEMMQKQDNLHEKMNLIASNEVTLQALAKSENSEDLLIKPNLNISEEIVYLKQEIGEMKERLSKLESK